MKSTQRNTQCYFLFLFFICTSAMVGGQTSQQEVTNNSYQSEYIFPFQHLHVHSSSIVELPNGDLLACWFEGSGERKANDVKIKGARLKFASHEWSKPFQMADTPGFPDCNPVLFLDVDGRLILYWIVVQGNQWETSILKYRVSSDYLSKEEPVWDWQDIILLKTDNSFAESIKNGFRELNTPGLAWAEYAPPYEKMIVEAAREPKKRETGWMTRTHPIRLNSGRILLPLYSDGFNLSLIAISDDRGKSWRPGLPIVGRGNVQPSLIQKKNGDIVAYMRDNGDEPGRIIRSVSTDKGYSWDMIEEIPIPNPGASVETLALKNGNWVMVYNDTENGRHRLVISLSDDEGSSWKWTRPLENHGMGEGSFSYPSICQTKNGLVHICYSFHLGKEKTIKHVSLIEVWIKDQ